MSGQREFYSKLLVFGEYTILDGGDALAIPLSLFSGKWDKGPGDPELAAFFEYLSGLDFIDNDKIQGGETETLSFKSSIPVGYGLGSSGALSAAAYAWFSLDDKPGIDELRRRLSVIEGFFHGSSSGIDPLTIFLDKAVANVDGVLDTCDINLSPVQLSIIDSGVSRDSKRMISVFQDKGKSEEFAEALKKLKAYNKTIIQSCLEENWKDFEAGFFKISALQWDYFNEMITDELKPYWEEGLSSKEYAIKLSGAGGGGFYLGYGKIPETLNSKLLSGKFFE